MKTSEAKWKIVYGHHAMYSEGSHGSDMWLKKYLKPMLEKYNVDFYAAGHDHDKQLFKPKNGVNYLVSGAGAKLRKVKKDDDHYFAKASYGFAHMLIKEKELVLRFVGLGGSVEYERKYKK